MSLREEFEKEKCNNEECKEKCPRPCGCYIEWLEKRDEKREKLLYQKRQAKEELLEAVQRLFDLRKRKKVRIFNAEVSFDKEIEQLITKHTQER